MQKQECWFHLLAITMIMLIFSGEKYGCVSKQTQQITAV